MIVLYQSVIRVEETGPHVARKKHYCLLSYKKEDTTHHILLSSVSNYRPRKQEEEHQFVKHHSLINILMERFDFK